MLCKCLKQVNLLSASDVKSRNDDIATSDGYSAHTRNIIKNKSNVFERGENLLQNGTLHSVFTLSQSSEIKLES